MLSLGAPKQAVSQRMLCLSCGGLVCLAEHAVNVLTCLQDQRMCLIASSQLQFIELSVVCFNELKMIHSTKAADLVFARGVLKWKNKGIKWLVEMKWSQQ